MERLQKQLDFVLVADKLKQIGRQTYLADGSRKENDAEHSYHLALMAGLLAEYANEKIDVAKTMMMVLIHDIVEIDAGDTYAYDAKGYEDKEEREQKAAARLFGLLPQDQAVYLRQLWDEFEAMQTAEAKFANTLDKVQPLLLNDASGGKSWTDNRIRKEQVLKRNQYTADGSAKLWDYCRAVIDKNVRNGKLIGGEANEQQG